MSATAVSVEGVLSDSRIASSLMSAAEWEKVVATLAERGLDGGPAVRWAEGGMVADISLPRVWGMVASAAMGTWLVGGLLVAVRRRLRVVDALADWGLCGWVWWLLPGVREGLLLVAVAAGLDGVDAFLLSTPHYVYALMLGGWLAAFVSLATRRASLPGADPAAIRDGAWGLWVVVLLAAVYAAVFTVMNWQLYRGLWTPHGDTAMYEEHLWNLLHGKGFRSYLDQGLFLGEHIQVVHLLLIPVYILWPSHLLLELCQSLALASGGLAVYWMGQRRAGSAAGAWLAAAYLLYFPMQYLDIAVDLKTFRPESFGIPLLLFALDQMERGRWRTMIVLLLLTLSVKEDYAIVLAPLGVWMAASRWGEADEANRRPSWMLGLGVALFAAVYLAIATRVVIPWYRGGEELHYVRYFSKLGETPREIVWNMLTQPRLMADLLLTSKTAGYALAMLVPLGFLPVLSPGRLAVGLPVFVTLCLNELADGPWHHFHAPLVPIVVWAAVGGLPTAQAWISKWGVGRRRGPAAVSRQSADAVKVVAVAEGAQRNLPEDEANNKSLWPAQFAFASALCAGLFFSASPLGMQFWDAGSAFYWRKLYIPGKRAEMFARIEGTIPQDARVASTDFVHPRFTHYERSYDYSQYPRAVNDNKPGAPPDTDYIVIDTTHPYSTIHRPEDIPEYRENPGQWEVLPDRTEGYFIVLKRKGGD